MRGKSHHQIWYRLLLLLFIAIPFRVDWELSDIFDIREITKLHSLRCMVQSEICQILSHVAGNAANTPQRREDLILDQQAKLISRIKPNCFIQDSNTPDARGQHWIPNVIRYHTQGTNFWLYKDVAIESPARYQVFVLSVACIKMYSELSLHLTKMIQHVYMRSWKSRDLRNKRNLAGAIKRSLFLLCTG